MVRNPFDPICIPLTEEMRLHGIDASSARWLSVRFWNAFAEKSREKFQLFISHGWTILEIKEMIQKDRMTWRKSAEAIFATETMLIDAGLSDELARRLLIRYTRCVHLDPESVNDALETYREIGLDDDELRRLFFSHPRALKAPPFLIREWNKIRRSGTNTLHQCTMLSRKKQPMEGERTTSEEGTPLEEVRKEDVDETPPDLMLEFEHRRDWKHDLAIFFQIAAPDAPPKTIEREINKLKWIWDGTTQALGVLEELMLWTNLPKPTTATPNSPAIRLLVNVCTNPKLQDFLKLDPKIARFRIAALRRFILSERIDLPNVPTLLIQPWEDLGPDELRYRTNVLDAQELSPHRTKVLPLLFLPSRREFNASISALRIDWI